MRITQIIKLMTLGISLLFLASACGGVDLSSDRIAGFSLESRSERLADRVGETRARLSESTPDLSVITSRTVTLSQLQDVGIPVGSHEIACDAPLDLVLVEGMFDRESLFSTGVAMAGGSFESLAMQLVAEIYDPETNMPLGMIGGQNGGSLTGITQSSDGSIATSGIDDSLMLVSAETEQGKDTLIPEATCQ